ITGAGPKAQRGRALARPRSTSLEPRAWLRRTCLRPAGRPCLAWRTIPADRAHTVSDRGVDADRPARTRRSTRSSRPRVPTLPTDSNHGEGGRRRPTSPNRETIAWVSCSSRARGRPVGDARPRVHRPALEDDEHVATVATVPVGSGPGAVATVPTVAAEDIGCRRTRGDPGTAARPEGFGDPPVGR